MLLNSHISAYTRCLAEKVCGLVRSTWGTCQGEDKLGARDKILNTKVVRWACAGRALGKHSPISPAIIVFVPPHARIVLHFSYLHSHTYALTHTHTHTHCCSADRAVEW